MSSLIYKGIIHVIYLHYVSFISSSFRYFWSVHVLYTNDVTDIFDNRSVCKLYADDVKLYTLIENPSDFTDMQKNLNSLQQWSD